MIEICNLTKSYGDKLALDHVSFTVEKGEVVGFLGPNGAGKSTAMNIITGYISATDGYVKIDGDDILEKPYDVKRKIGYLPELPPLYSNMLVKEYLDFVYDLKQIKTDNKEKHIQSVMDKVKITDVQNRRIANLSKGYKQRVGLAQALLGDPQVLILDEPTVGLDPQQIIEIRDVIKQLGEKHTVILSSHILTEISAVCERVIIINKGKIVAQDSTKNLEQSMSEVIQIEIKVAANAQTALDTLSSVENIESIETVSSDSDTESEFLLKVKPEFEADVTKNISVSLAQNQTPILKLDKKMATLEDAFLKLVNVEKQDETDATDETNATQKDDNKEDSDNESNI